MRDLPVFPNGLARLLVLEAAYFRPNFYTRLRFLGGPHYLQESFCGAMARNANDLPSNNYDGNLGWAQIPYGPTWTADKIEKLIAKKVRQYNHKLYSLLTQNRAGRLVKLYDP